MLAARASVVAQSSSGERTIAVDELLQGPFTTTLEPNEIVTEVRVPDPGPRASGTYLKLERKVGDYATAAVAVQLSLSNGTIERGRHRADRRRAERTSGPPRPRVPCAAPSRPTRRSRRPHGSRRRPHDPQSDIRGTADYKRNVVRIFTERGLRTAVDGCGAAPEESEMAMSQIESRRSCTRSR